MITAAAGPGLQGLFFLLVLGLVITIGILLSQDRKRPELLRRVAGHVGGTVIEGGWLKESEVHFRIAGLSAHLGFFAGSKYNPPWSRVAVPLNGRSPGTLHILEDGFAQGFLKLFGAQDLRIGDADFDRDYVIKATPESLASRIFRPEQRAEVIRTVRRLKGFADPTFDVTPHELTVTVRRYLRDEQSILVLIHAATEFLDHVLKHPVPPGVVLGELTTAAGGSCPVCGTLLSDSVVRCGTCRAAHHGECWAYVGRCSAYACPGRSAR